MLPLYCALQEDQGHQQFVGTDREPSRQAAGAMAAATAQLASFETGHGDMVHDAAFDYYGKRLATCSSDRSIKVFEVVGDQVRVPWPALLAAASTDAAFAALFTAVCCKLCGTPRVRSLKNAQSVGFATLALPRCRPCGPTPALPQITLLADLNGHEGPVWQVAWAHPKFGSLLASCRWVLAPALPSAAACDMQACARAAKGQPSAIPASRAGMCVCAGRKPEGSALPRLLAAALTAA